jgi:hypothetical protein
MCPEIASSGSALADYPRLPNTMAMTAPTAIQARSIIFSDSVESSHAAPTTHTATGLSRGFLGSVRVHEALAAVLPLVTDVVMAFGKRDLRGRAGYQRNTKKCKNDLTHSYLHP